MKTELPFPRRAVVDARLASDEIFDSVYEKPMRVLSKRHWTPVAVAARAAELLTQAGATRILDVGSGVGKFCLVGAMGTDAEFVGIDRRENLVDVARETAAGLRVTRATFVHANVTDVSFEGFDGVFLFNPFFEHVRQGLRPIDGTAERSRNTYRVLVAATLAKLRTLASPGVVVTFAGFGGRVPPDAFEFLGEEAAGNDWLEMWVKR
jgi:2-polyprenyl-3-methyl-5-hydroxy-6-metoxy-1,4-benzoquinol methylase